MTSLGRVDDSLLEAVLVNIAVARDKIGFGAYVDSHRLDRLGSISTRTNGVRDELEIVRSSFNADSVTGCAGAAVVLDSVFLESVPVASVGLILITEIDSRMAVFPDDVLEEDIIGVLVPDGDSVSSVVPRLITLIDGVLDAPAQEKAILPIIVRAVEAHLAPQSTGSQVNHQIGVPVGLALRAAADIRFVNVCVFAKRNLARRRLTLGCV